MQIESLELINFCQYRFRRFEFGPGLIAIIGPNGSGKSNMLGAMKFALTGDHPNVGGKNANVSDYIQDGERSSVRFVFSHAGEHCDVIRYLTSGQTILRLGRGEPIRGDRRVNARILDILGSIDKQILNDIVLVDQGAIFGFLAQQKAERAAAFGRLFGTSQAEACWTVLGRHAVNIAVPTTAVDLDSYRRAIDTDRNRQAELATSLNGETSEGLQAEIKQLRAAELAIEKRNTAQNRLLQLNGQHTLATQNRDQAAAKLTEIDGDIQALQQATSAAEPLAHAARADLQSLVQRRQIEAERQRGTNQIQHFRTQLDALRPPVKPDDYAEDLQQDINQAHTEVTWAESFIASFDPVTGVAECIVCHTPATNLQEELGKIQEALPGLRSRLAALTGQQARSTAYQQRLRTHEAETQRLSGLIYQCEQQLQGMAGVEAPSRSENELQRIVDDHQQYVKAIEALLASREPWSAAMTTWTTTRDSIAVQIDEVNQELAKIVVPPLAFAEAVIVQAVADRQARLIEVQWAEHELIAVRARITQAQEFIAGTAQAQLVARTNREWLSRVERYRNLLHRDAAPRFVAQRNLARAQRGVDANLAMFETDFRVTADDDSLSFQANFLDGRQQPAVRLSFGQKVILALSFRLALNFMFADLGFLALDEPTAWLDAHHIEGFEPVLLRLREFAASRGLQCLMITHEQSLAPLFDSVIRL
jgi:DNA repair exonuclease SbcCD ATPase subunit